MNPHSATKIRLLLVDDHEVVRVGLRAVLEKTGQIQVVGEAGSMAMAINEAMRLRPDIVLMDIRLPDGSGVEACREIRDTCPNTRVLFLTSYDDEDAVMATIAAGAEGYLLKEIHSPGLIKAIKTVASGQSVLDPSVTRPVLSRLRVLSDQDTAPSKSGLSGQERRVLKLVADGRSNKDIAVALALREKTVKNYLTRIFEKLRVTSRAQAAVLYNKRYPQ